MQAQTSDCARPSSYARDFPLVQIAVFGARLRSSRFASGYTILSICSITICQRDVNTSWHFPLLGVQARCAIGKGFRKLVVLRHKTCRLSRLVTLVLPCYPQVSLRLSGRGQHSNTSSHASSIAFENSVSSIFAATVRTSISGFNLSASALTKSISSAGS